MITRRILVLVLTLVVLSMIVGSNHSTAGFRQSAEKPVPDEYAPTADWRVGTNFMISNESQLVEFNPSVAYNSTRSQYLVVWYNDRPGNDDIRAQRVSKDGRLLGGPFYISAAGDGIDRRFPDVAYNVKADQYLVVWEHQNISAGYSIHGRRVSGTGMVLDENDIVIQGAGYNLYTPVKPAVAYAYTSDKYLVIWEETWHPTPITTSIMGRKVLATGVVDGGSFTISAGEEGEPKTNPDLAYNLGRNEYLVAWEQYDKDDKLTDIYIRRVTGDGLPLYPELTNISFYTVSCTSPAVAALSIPSDGQYLVVWELHYSTTDWDIYGDLVNADGVVGTSFDIIATNAHETAPAVVGSLSRSKYLVVWSNMYAPPYIFADIEGRLISTVGSKPGNAFSLGGLVADNPGLAAEPTGDYFAVFDDTPLTPDSGIYGQLIGNRGYLPLIIK